MTRNVSFGPREPDGNRLLPCCCGTCLLHIKATYLQLQCWEFVFNNAEIDEYFQFHDEIHFGDSDGDVCVRVNLTKCKRELSFPSSLEQMSLPPRSEELEVFVKFIKCSESLIQHYNKVFEAL